MYRGSTLSLGLQAALVAALLAPVAVFAQESSLRATIETQLRADPNSASLNEAEFRGIVDALVEEAESRGVTSADLAFAPVPSAAEGDDAVFASGPFSTLQISIAGVIGLLVLLAISWLLYRWLHTPEPAPVSQVPPFPPSGAAL